VENEILLIRIKGRHPNVLRSYLRCRKRGNKGIVKANWVLASVRTSGKLKREWEEIQNLARGMDETSRQAQTDKKGKRIVEG
jgi:hypothetical protein